MLDTERRIMKPCVASESGLYMNDGPRSRGSCFFGKATCLEEGCSRQLGCFVVLGVTSAVPLCPCCEPAPAWEECFAGFDVSQRCGGRTGWMLPCSEVADDASEVAAVGSRLGHSPVPAAPLPCQHPYPSA